MTTTTTTTTAAPVFYLGRVVITPCAMATMDNLFGNQARQKTCDLLDRHAAGDDGDGDLSAEDKRANLRAQLEGDRIFSSYNLADAGDEDAPRLWIITEAKGDDGHRYSTCIMTPSEY